MNRIKRARGINGMMTGIFNLIAVFFFVLLIAFAGYVIIKGFTGASPEMFLFERKGSIGNQLFNTIYLVFISLVFSVPLGVMAGIYLSMYAKKGLLTKFLRICIDAPLPSLHRSRSVRIPGIPCILRTEQESSGRCAFDFDSGDSCHYDDNRGCDQWPS